MIEYDNKAWLKLIFTTKGAIIRSISARLLLFAAVAAGLAGLHKSGYPIAVTPVPWTIAGVALGLLLVFRTNTSYDRFWEGRRMWGQLINSARSFSRGVTCYIDSGEQGLAFRKNLLQLYTATLYAAKQRLRQENELSEYSDFLTTTEKRAIDEVRNIPFLLLTLAAKRLAACVKEGLLDPVHLPVLERHLEVATDCIGACERIRNTPLPIAYVLHIKRFSVLFCLTVPLALVEPLGWGAVPVSALISYVFIGIDEIGVEIEDPFGDDPNDLPLDDFCRGVQLCFDELLDKEPQLVSTNAEVSST